MKKYYIDTISGYPVLGSDKSISASKIYEVDGSDKTLKDLNIWHADDDANRMEFADNGTDAYMVLPVFNENSHEDDDELWFGWKKTDGFNFYKNEVPTPSSADNGKVLTVNNGTPIWQSTSTASKDTGVYEVTVTKILDGSTTDTLWNGTVNESELSETYINCDTTTCPVHITLDYAGRLQVGLRAGYNSITCESHVFVSSNSNFGTELGYWGHTTEFSQVVAGMNRTWYLQHNDYLVQNGIHSTTETAKEGTLTIKFDFVFNI